MAFDVRQARPADAPALFAMWRALMEQHMALEPRFVLAADADHRWRNDLAVWLVDDFHRFFVATDDGRPVGFVHGQRWRPYPIYGDALELFIAELYVDEAVRRSGLGGALLERMRAWGREVRAARLRLGVLSRNAEGMAFWDASGAQALSVEYTIELEQTPESAPKKPGRLGFFSGT
ncbi:MAG: GNAT family N-acetyltransferase [Rhodothermales bacterium]